MTTRSASWSPPADLRPLGVGDARRRRPPGGSLGAPPRRAVRRLRDRRHRRLPALRRRHARRRGAVPGLRARVPARRPPGLPAPLAGREDDYRAAFEGLMLPCGFAVLAARRRRARRRGASARQVHAAVGFAALAPLRARLRRPDPLRPLARGAPGGALAALAAAGGRLGLGLLEAPAAAKLYPLVVLPLARSFVGRRHGRRAALESLGDLRGRGRRDRRAVRGLSRRTGS